MHEALIGGNELQIRKLISTNDLDINKPDKGGNTLLHLAVLSGNESSVKAILDLEPDPTIKNKQGKTPLQLAKTLGGEIAENTAHQLDEHLRIEVIRSTPNKEFVNKLVLGGADPSSKDLQGKSTVSILESGGRRGYFKTKDELDPSSKELELLDIIELATQQKEKEPTPKEPSKKVRKSIKSIIQSMRKKISFNFSVSEKAKNFFYSNKRNSRKTTGRQK